MKTVKLIALDLDGTLVREDQSISEEDKAAVARAQRAGVAVVIATGRIFPTARPLLSSLNLGTPVICCNGADVREGAGSIFGMTIERNYLEKAYTAMGKYPVQRFVFFGDHIYCTKGNDNEPLFEKWGLENIRNGLIVYCKDLNGIIQKVGDNAAKLLVCTPDQSRHEAIRRDVTALSYFDVVKGEALNFELTRKGATKGTALKVVAQKLGVDMKNVMAIGDSLNDYEMIRSAGMGIAMGNAMQEVLDIADDVTLPIGQNGVAHAINKYVFGEKTKSLRAVLSPV